MKAHDKRIIGSSGESIYRTPEDLALTLDAEFNFTLDACASADNAIVPASYFGPDHFDSKRRDALKAPWSLGEMQGRVRAFMNPPYSRELKIAIAPFVQKAHDEARKNRHTVVALLPAAIQTRWWRRWCLDADEIRFFPHRLSFWLSKEEHAAIDDRRRAEGKKPLAADLGNSNVNHAVVIWRPHYGLYVGHHAPRVIWWSHLK